MYIKGIRCHQPDPGTTGEFVYGCVTINYILFEITWPILILNVLCLIVHLVRNKIMRAHMSTVFER